jgi:hypothetical protein
MERSRLILGAAGAAVAVAGAAAFVYRAELFGPSPDEQWAIVRNYCLECHNAAEAAGGVVFEGMGPDSVALEPETFEAAVRKLRGRLMPPPGNPQPDQPRIDSLVAWLERTIDRNAVLPHAGHVPIQRLNRTEYAAAVKDLVGVEIDAAEFLPAEIEVDGLDKIAAALSVSPAFLEQYIAAARHIAHLAVGEPKPKLMSVSFPPPPNAEDQDDYIDGMPLGTRGGMRFTHNFLADGEYRITMIDLDIGQYARSLESEHTVVMLLDRNEVFRSQLGGREELMFYNRDGAPAKAAAVREDSGTDHGRCARDRDHVRRARPRSDGGSHLRLPAVRRFRLHGEDARAEGRETHPDRRAVRHDGPRAHGEPRQDLRLYAGGGG